MNEPDPAGAPEIGADAPQAITTPEPAPPTAPAVRDVTRPWAWTIGLAVLALLARVLPTWNAVFGEDHVSFLETDAWYHMRLVDALLADFPWRIWHDAYLVHPGGEPVNAGPVFDWMVALPAWLLGLGSPSARFIDIVGAFVPPVVGALTVLPVVALGASLFSIRAGLWAGLLFAVMPGQTLQRSLLGFTDHHCAETLLSTTALLFLVRALVEPVRRRRNALLAGLGLGLYLLTWGGGVFVVVLIVAWAVLAIATRIWRAATFDDITSVAMTMLGVAAVMVVPWARARPHFAYQVGAMAGGLLLLAVLRAAASRAGRRGWGPGRLLATMAGATVIAGVVAAVVMGDSLGSLRGDLSRVSPFRGDTIVSEARPLLAARGMMRPVPLWPEFGVGSVLAALGVGMLAGSGGRSRAAALGLFALWTMVTVGATLGQVRFTYYLGVNVALLSGLAADRLVHAGGRRQAMRVAIAAIIAGAIVLPTMPRLYAMRTSTPWPDRNWMDALSWMRANTPEPFGDEGSYVSVRVDRPSSYGVLSWWDAGYWITRIARRVPVTNPRQTAMGDVARFLVETDVAAARALIDRLGARYVIVDAQLQAQLPMGARRGGFFMPIVIAAGKSTSTFCESYLDRQSGRGVEFLCTPAYHQTMAMRLYRHGGRAVTDVAPVRVLKVRRQRGINEVQLSWDFTHLEEARAFAASRQDPGSMRVVCPDLRRSCVPLPELPDFVSTYRSISTETGELEAPSVVHVFEYRPTARMRP